MTAEKYINEWNSLEGNFSDLRLKDLLITFAQYHVQEALKQASENSKLHPILEDFIADSWESTSPINKDSILNAYPLSKIK